ncbi:MAG: CBS domain-containing protein [Bacteroidetes bacterium]|jgi:acetoin utilization protein AcuB|nr:CBS domain-containing protein [Bacteroidota bacterium]
MRAQQLLTSDLPLLHPIDTVSNAIQLMDEYKVSHLPLVVEDMFKGLINEEDLLECDKDAVLAEVDTHPIFVDPNIHIYEVVAQMAQAKIDVLPVVIQGKYMGCIDRGSILNFFAQESGWALEGSIVVLEIPAANYSLSKISRIVEENGARITSFNMNHLDSGDLVVSMKVNTINIATIMASFERFDYKVLNFYNSPEVEDEIRNKFEAFMRYLES